MKHKFTLDGEPIVIKKCKLCGKLKGDHKALTLECPKDRKIKGFGHSVYGPEVYKDD